MTCKPSRSPPPGQDFSKGRVLSRVHTGWFCLDCKLMPWSAKARELLQRQYAPVGAAGVAALEAVIEGVIQSPPASGMADAYRHRLERLWKRGQGAFREDEPMAHGDVTRAGRRRSAPATAVAWGIGETVAGST